MKVYIAGHTGFTGKAIYNKLIKENRYDTIVRSHDRLDLKIYDDTLSFFLKSKPDIVIDCAAIVGGIQANIDNPYKFLYDNLQIQNNLIDCSIKAGVNKFIFLGSSCIYPKDYTQPLKEEYLLRAPLEPTNEGYALAKISGLKLCEYANRVQDKTNFISLMPCNLYGPGDNFDLKSSHVLSALIKKIDTAKQNGGATVEVWGTGKPRREFLFIDDLVDAIIWSMQNITKVSEFINVGTGEDISIKNLAEKIALKLNYKGSLVFDETKPDGMMVKRLDISKINSLGWHAKTSFDEGLYKTIKYYEENIVKK